MIKNLPATAGDVRDSVSISGLGRAPEGGHGNPLQYSYLQNPMDRGTGRLVHRVAESQTQFSTHSACIFILVVKVQGPATLPY